MLEFLIMTGVFLALTIPAYLLIGDHETRSFDGPYHLSQLASQMKLSGEGVWDVTILRRSGYVHDAWQYTGSATAALQTGVQKMRQARQEEVAITINSESKFAITAFYESTGARRTGKYIGGFEIAQAG